MYRNLQLQTLDYESILNYGIHDNNGGVESIPVSAESELIKKSLQAIPSKCTVQNVYDLLTLEMNTINFMVVFCKFSILPLPKNNFYMIVYKLE